MQYGYKDWVPSQSYYAFATKVGCAPTTAYGSSPQTVFSCLVSKDTYALQNASASISSSGTYGTWGFLPVTDGNFVQQLPSQQLLQKKVNGERLLIGNNANEGPGFTPQNITTEDDLLVWLQLTFPLFSNDDIAKILLYYPSTNASVDNSIPEYSTLGDTGPTAINESDVATGQQQRADVSRLKSSDPEPLTDQFCSAEHLRRDHFRLPKLLDGRGVRGLVIQVPVQCACGAARRRHLKLLWSRDAQSRT